MALRPYVRGLMKMTMNIDEDVLSEVIRITGVASKTKAVEVALTEMVRRYRFKEIASAGLGLTPEELKNAWEEPNFSKPWPPVAVEIPKDDARKRSRR